MVDIDLVPGSIYVRNGYWSLAATWTVQANALSENYELKGKNLPTLAQYGDTVLVDGMTFRYTTPLGSAVVRPWVRSIGTGTSTLHYLGEHTNANPTVIGYASALGIPLTVNLISDFGILGMYVASALQLDALRFTAWGRYALPSEDPTVTPVQLEGIRWPLPRRRY